VRSRRIQSFKAAAFSLALAGVAIVAFGTRPASAKDHVVEIRGLEFVPASIEARAGDTVTWVNTDVMPHTATSDAGAWDSGEIAAGASWTLSVEDGFGGGYTCTYHPAMSGEIAID